nr:DUF892 family protein [Gluconobacter wancherniae]
MPKSGRGKTVSRIKLAKKSPFEVYQTRLEEHLSIVSKAVDTMLTELPRAINYPELHSRMNFDLSMARSHLEQIENLVAQRGIAAPFSLETVSSVIDNVSSLLHGGETNDVLTNAMAAAGYKAHQIASFDALIALAAHLGFEADLKTLSSMREEEYSSARWLERNMGAIVKRYLTCQN